jgi:hypothetical protein
MDGKHQLKNKNLWITIDEDSMQQNAQLPTHSTPPIMDRYAQLTNRNKNEIMNNKYFYLAAGICALLMLTSTFSKTNDSELIIWVTRIMWLAGTFVFISTYLKMKKSENTSKEDSKIN